GGRSIERVPDYGMPQRSHVDANLMGAPGFNTNRGQGEAAVRAVNAPQDLPVRDRAAAALASCGHASAADGVAADRSIHRSAILRQLALHQRDVELSYLPAREHRCQPGMRD